MTGPGPGSRRRPGVVDGPYSGATPTTGVTGNGATVRTYKCAESPDTIDGFFFLSVSYFILFFFFVRVFSTYAYAHTVSRAKSVSGRYFRRTDGKKKNKKNKIYIKKNTQTISSGARIHTHTHTRTRLTPEHTRTHAARFVPTVFAARRLPVVSLSIGGRVPRATHTHTYL